MVAGAEISQRLAELDAASKARRRVARDAPIDDARERVRDVGAHGFQGGSIRAEVRVPQLQEARRLVQRPARRRLEHHGPERVDIRRRRDLVAGELLGGHVQRRADDRSFERHDGGCCRFARLRARLFHRVRARDAEVRDDGAPFAGPKKDVRRLQIAMDDARLVRRREAGRQIARQTEELRGREHGPARDSFAERLPLDELHRQTDAVVDLDEIVDTDDAGMRHLAGERELSAEAGEAHGRSVVREQLEREDGVRLRVARAEHDPLGPAPDLAEDDVALSEDLPLGERGASRVVLRGVHRR